VFDITGYKLAVSEILSVLAYITCPRYPESTDSMTGIKGIKNVTRNTHGAK